MDPVHYHPTLNTLLDFPIPTLLDVTLRDGSLAVNFDWKENSIRILVQSLANASIPFIELGYLGGVPELHNAPKIGITNDFPLSFAKELVDENPLSKYSLMIHPGSLKKKPEFDLIKQAGITLVRFVYHPSWHDQLVELLYEAQENDLIVSVNLALASRYHPVRLLQICDNIARLKPNILYIADTCSAYYPDQIKTLFHTLSSICECELGFHAHDFLSLAFANSLASCVTGASYIDVSITGIGRGAGNLKAETWLVTAISQNTYMYDVKSLVPAIKEIAEYIPEKDEKNLLHIVAGAFNLTPPEEDLFYETASYDNSSAQLFALNYAMKSGKIEPTNKEQFKGVLLNDNTTR